MVVDRSRPFSLPGIHDLNKGQDEALALPLEGQHLIIGGPGTGKSVVALLRARRLERDGRKYRLLVYNHLLAHSNDFLYSGEKPLVQDTWDRWIRAILKYFFRTVPLCEPDSPNGYRHIDWSAVRQLTTGEFVSMDWSDKYLIIDEGQDMPPAFYETLAQLGLENFYVAADQNQQIDPEQCSSRREIEAVLGIDAEDSLELKTNFRNALPTALLAGHLRPKDRASPPPDLPPASISAAIPELWTYGQPGRPGFSEIMDRVLQMSDRNPRKLIGVIAPDNTIRKKFIAGLEHSNPNLDNGKPPIHTYSSGQKCDLPDFGKGGLVVINAKSCKGLEFDTVILADIDDFKPKGDLHTLQAMFYVMVSRARERVILLRSGKPCPVVESLLPTSSDVLVRK